MSCITIYSCEADEADLFRNLAPGLNVELVISTEAVTESTVQLAAGSRCISVGHKTSITNPTLLALSRAGVLYVSTRSIGSNHIDIDYAESLGITVGNVDYSPDSVADYTLMLMLMTVRNAKSVLRRAEAHDYRLGETRGRELRDLTVGVIGTGRIGTAVIDRLQGFGCRVLAHDVRPKAVATTDYIPLDDLLRQSDIVTLHTPLTAASHHLLDDARFERLKMGAHVINTGRGALIDTPALLRALNSGRIGGAALDVVEGEEGLFYEDHRDTEHRGEALWQLQSMPSVIITPHTAFYTDHALRDTVENSLLNCLRFERRTQHA